MKKPFSQIFAQTVLGLMFTIFFITLSVIIVLNFRPLYFITARLMDLEGTYGLSFQQIKENYHTLIQYNSPFYFGILQFPDLPSSREALIHFAEVKILFMDIYLFFVASALSLWILLPTQYHNKTLGDALKFSAGMMILLPALVGGAIAINFDRAFVLFHEIFFRNDFWLFDPATDPIILLLPDTFFFVCAATIVLLVLASVIGLFLLSRYFKKKEAETEENTENFL